MGRTVGAIERDLDNAMVEANNGQAGSVEKLERLRQELAGEHVLSADCWCGPDVEHVESGTSSAPDEASGSDPDEAAQVAEGAEDVKPKAQAKPKATKPGQ